MTRNPDPAVPFQRGKRTNFFSSVAARAQAVPARSHIRILGLGALLLAGAGARAQNGVFVSQAVGIASTGQAVQVTAPSGGIVAGVQVLTMGAPSAALANPDFSPGTGSSCVSTTSLAAGASCSQSVVFTPSAPGLRLGAVEILDGSGNVLGTQLLSGTGLGPLPVLNPGNVIPVAGVMGEYLGSDGDGGAATSAKLDLPYSVALDGLGNMYIADSAHNRVRMVCGAAAASTIKGATCAGSGNISTITGNGGPGYVDKVPAASGTVSNPTGVAVDGAGNLYIADSGNNVIRMISAATGEITTVAGGGSGCNATGADALGDGCSPLEAVLNGTSGLGITVDAGGNLFIADTADQLIREVSASTKLITAVAGNGYVTANGMGGYNGDNVAATDAKLNNPSAVAFDAAGNMYIPDSSNNRLRMVCASATSAPAWVTGCTAADIILTVAGTGVAGTGGWSTGTNSAGTLPLWAPSGVAVDAAGNVYIADTQNDAIRKIHGVSGLGSNVAMSNSGTFYYRNQFSLINLYGPTGLALDGNANLYVVDTMNVVVRKIQSTQTYLDFLAQNNPVYEGQTSAAIDQLVENDGNLPLTLTDIDTTTDPGAELGAATTCTSYLAPGALTVDSDCVIAAEYAPPLSLGLTAETVETSNILIDSATANPQLNIELVDNALPVNATQISVTSNPAGTSVYGQAVTFTATVTTGSGTLTGTVTLTDTYNNTTVTLASGLALNSSNQAVYTTTATAPLGVGGHSIVASYDNTKDPNHLASTSAASPLLLTVDEGTTTAIQLTTGTNPSVYGAQVAFTATVSLASPVASASNGFVSPAGTVVFYDGATALTTTPVTLTVSSNTSTSGTAVYSTAGLAQGQHQITAVFTPATGIYVNGSTSKALTLDVQATTQTVLTSTPNPSTYGGSVAFLVVVTPSGATAATGTVNLVYGGNTINTGTLTAASNNQVTINYSKLPVGTNESITADYLGDNANSSSNSPAYLQTVNQVATTTAVAAAPSAGIAGLQETITATVTPSSGTGTIGGTVTFTATNSAGTINLGSPSLNTSANPETAAVTYTFAPGAYTIAATYSGDTNDSGSTNSTQLTVNQATTKTVVSASPTPAEVLQPITFTATVTGNGGTPTGTVFFLSNGTQIGQGNLDKTGEATYTDTSGLAVGTYQITASYQGDTDDAVSLSSAVSLTVGTIPTTTDLGTAATTGSNPQTILVATVLATTGPTPSGTVAFMDGTTQIGSATLDANGVATLTPNLTAGTNYTITAVYSGNTVDATSTSQPVTVSGTAAGFSISAAPSTVSLVAGQNQTITVSLQSNGGFTDTIGLGCASLPAGVTCIFSSPSVALSANGTASAQLTIDTNNPLSGGQSAMNGRSSRGGAMLAGLCAPFGIVFGLLLFLGRRQRAAFLTALVAAVFSAAVLTATGCNGFSMGKAAAGTYTIQITGTGTNTDVIHYQNESLTITQ